MGWKAEGQTAHSYPALLDAVAARPSRVSSSPACHCPSCVFEVACAFTKRRLGRSRYICDIDNAFTRQDRPALFPCNDLIGPIEALTSDVHETAVRERHAKPKAVTYSL